ncbi:MAG TPA: MarR family transcriptional regulator [Microthrixaceae bacterium]|nr:MarR family transcriptional regulator [Microthrixaceae bacterium]
MSHASDLFSTVGTSPSPPSTQSRADLERRVGELLTDLGERLRRRTRTLAEGTELRLADLQLLHVLLHGPMRMGELAEELGYDASHITALVDRLEALNYVERQGDAHDRRVKRIVLTSRGRRRIKTFERQLFGDAELLARLTPAQLRHLAELLGRAVG